MGDALRQQGEVCGMTFEALIKDIKSSYVHRRVDAARELGKLGDKRAFDHLVIALGDPDHNVRDNAAFALGELGIEEAVPHLVELLRDEDEWVRKGAVKALGMIGSKKAVKYLAVILERDPAFIVRRAAVRSLGQIADKKAVDSMKLGLYDKNVTVRDMAKKVLAMLGGDTKK